MSQKTGTLFNANGLIQGYPYIRPQSAITEGRRLYATMAVMFGVLLATPTLAAQNEYGCEICPTGQKFTETQTGFECVACDIPANATATAWPSDYCMAVTCSGNDCYIGMNECPWECDAGHVELNGVCTADTVTCEQSYYLPSNSRECELCTEDHACAGGTYTPSTTTPQGIISCPSGQTGNTRLGAYKCVPYKRLHSNGTTAVMRDEKNDENDLNMCVKPDDESTIYYGGLSTVEIPNTIQIRISGITYWLKPNEEFEVPGGGGGGGTFDSSYSPDSCNNYLQCPANGDSGQSYNRECHGGNNLSEREWTVYDCTGGKGVERFAGTSVCTDTNDGKPDYGQPGWPQQGNPGADTTGGYCWCQIESVDGQPVAPSSRFVFVSDYDDASNCAYYCAYYCARNARYYGDFRPALFAALGS